MNEFYKKGKEEALEDIKADKLKLKAIGLKELWFGEWREILSKEYEIEIESIAGCIILNNEDKYATGYNEISEKEIKKRFGNEILDKTLKKAESVWKTKSYIPGEIYTENGNKEMIAIPNKYGWINCPNCNISFKFSSEASWNGRFHLSCGQKIKIIEIKN